MKYLILVLSLICGIANAQEPTDEQMMKSIYNTALEAGEAYDMLRDLSLNIGHRLSGSPQAAAAVEWSRQLMQSYNFDTVYLQEVMVPHWVRGQKEITRIVNSKKYGAKELNALALGNSVGTGPAGVLAEVIEVNSLDEVERLGSKARGKIIFYNRPMDPTHIQTFKAYGGAVDQRVYGANEAAKVGALAVVIRSVASNKDYTPHTGTLVYEDGVKQLPAVAISTLDADMLSDALKHDEALRMYIETHCEMLPDVLSYNVIGELRGSEKPEEYIVVGGHLDSWDVGDGSHDDGAGCVQAIEVLRLFKALNYKPKHSIRAVMFMNEENGLRGGKKYAEVAATKNEKHIAALESDSGGFSPRGFRMSGNDDDMKQVQRWANLFEPYGLYDFNQPGGGADIGPLKQQGTLLIGLSPDSQRYFNYHHTAEDTFDKVNHRELALGAAAMAALTYLIDQHGL